MLQYTKEESKASIVRYFHQNVLGKFPDPSYLKSKHNGKLGHWLEVGLGGDIDADGKADLNGFECKVDSPKVSWGDWGANYRIFADKSFSAFDNKFIVNNMWEFVRIFGVPRDDPIKGKYFSWSGDHVPEIINESKFTGISLVERDCDISMIYNYEDDKRENKDQCVPLQFKKENLVLLKWYGKNESFNNFVADLKNRQLPIEIKLTGKNASVSLEERIRRKFGIYGIVAGLHNKVDGFYGLKFLKRVTLEDWMSYFKNKNVIFDTGLTTRNARPRNQWRSTKKFMATLEEDRYIPRNV
jgi:hypothetical protein